MPDKPTIAELKSLDPGVAPDGRGLIIGKDEIARYVGRSWSQIKRYQYDFGLPVRRWITGNRPFIIIAEFHQWLVLLSEKIREDEERNRKCRKK